MSRVLISLRGIQYAGTQVSAVTAKYDTLQTNKVTYTWLYGQNDNQPFHNSRPRMDQTTIYLLMSMQMEGMD